MQFNKTNQTGFTLIEILVVLSIISVLAVFLVPKLMGIQDRGKEAAVKSIAKNVQLAVEAYQMENEVFPMGTNIRLASLVTNYLAPGGYMLIIPVNPYTGKPYGDGDNAGKIIYTYNDSNGQYNISAYKRNGFSKIIELSNL
jgi:general secretion pathway protein G